MNHHVYISAGELSGDIIGADLIHRLQTFATTHSPPLSLQFFGMGGPHMAACGAELFTTVSDTSAMGIWETLSKIHFFVSLEKKILQHIRQTSPTVCILIDFPGFHLRLARKIQALDIPVVQYIAPKVWASFEGRITHMRRHLDLSLGVFPFEESFFHSHHVPYTLTSFPHAQRITHTHAFDLKDWISDTDHTTVPIALLPGSRSTEIHRLAKTYRRCIKHIRQHFNAQQQRPLFVMPISTSLSFAEVVHQLLPPKERPKTVPTPSAGTATSAALSSPFHTNDMLFISGHSLEVMKACKVALITSGTASLECGLLGIPHAIIYRAHPLSYQIFKRKIRVPYASLVNLTLDRPAVREFLQHLDDHTIANHLMALLTDAPLRARILQDLQDLQNIYLPASGRNDAPQHPHAATILWQTFFSSPYKKTWVLPHSYRPLFSTLPKLLRTIWPPRLLLWLAAQIYAQTHIRRHQWQNFLKKADIRTPHILPGCVIALSTLDRSDDSLSLVIHLIKHWQAQKRKVVFISRPSPRFSYDPWTTQHIGHLSSQHPPHILDLRRPLMRQCQTLLGPLLRLLGRSRGISKDPLWKAHTITTLTGIDCVFGHNTLKACRYYLAQHPPPDLWILDQGFSRFHLHKSLDILVCDATQDISQEPLWPYGRLHIPWKASRQAQAFILTRMGPTRLWGLWQHTPTFYAHHPHLTFWEVSSLSSASTSSSSPPHFPPPHLKILPRPPQSSWVLICHHSKASSLKRILKQHHHHPASTIPLPSPSLSLPSTYTSEPLPQSSQPYLMPIEDYFQYPSFAHRYGTKIILFAPQTSLNDDFFSYIHSMCDLPPPLSSQGPFFQK